MKTLPNAALVAAVLVLLCLPAFGQEGQPDLTVGVGKAPASAGTSKPEEKKADEKPAEPAKIVCQFCEKEGHAAKACPDLKQKVEPPKAPAPAKAPAKAVAKKPAKKARVAIRVVKPDPRDAKLRELEQRLAKAEGVERSLRASYAGFKSGIEAGKATAPGTSITVHGANATATATAHGSRAKTGSAEAEPKAPTTEPGAPQGADGKTPDPKAPPAKGKGRAASSEQSLEPRGVPVRFTIPKGMGKLGG